MVKIIIGVVVAAVVLISGFLILNVATENTNENNTQEVSSDSHSYTIEGEVDKPGTYSLKDEVTMADLITAAGGITSNTDVRSYIETTVLTSGTTYYIGSLYDSEDICQSQEIVKANINSDTSETLSSISVISSSIANSIVSHRLENGEFVTLEGLLDVYGIGNATYRKIRNYVILHE